MVLEYVAGTPLSRELSAGDFNGAALGALGAEVAVLSPALARVTSGRLGLFADEHLSVRAERSWSRQLPEVAAPCTTRHSQARLDVLGVGVGVHEPGVMSMLTSGYRRRRQLASSNAQCGTRQSRPTPGCLRP
jgi:hypothetical protein